LPVPALPPFAHWCCVASCGETLLVPGGTTMQVVLETDRLVLRRCSEADAEHLFALESDPEGMRYIWRKSMGDVEAYRQFIVANILPWYDRPEGVGTWAVLAKTSRAFLGVGSLKPAIESRQAVEMRYGPGEIELGYGLRRLFWGQG